MKILHVTPYYKPAFVYGGPIHSVSALCEALVAHGHDVTVVTTNADGDNSISLSNEVIENVKVLRFKKYLKNNTFFAPGTFFYLLKNINKYDVVHIHTWWNLVSIFALMICSIKGKRPVLSPRGMLSDYIIKTNNPSQKKVIQWLFGKSMLSKVKFHATAISEEVEIKGLYPNSTVQEIFNFVKIPEIKTNPLSSDETIKLIFLSRIDPKKGIEILIEALATIEWDYHLTIVGPSNDDKYLETLKNLAGSLGITDNITWLGSVFGQQKFELLASHDLMVLPSYNENFANVVIETLAMGTPVLISNMVGLYPYIEKENLGWICDTSSQDIAHQLSLFKNDSKKRQFIRSEAAGLIRRHFNSDVLVQKYMQYYLS